MHIECLEYFQKIAEIKSISKVADRSHISQSALSQQIQKLEDILGQKLFERSNRGVKLTQAGEIVYKYADNIIRTYDKMIDGLNNQEKEDVKIEADSTIATYCLPCALLKMQNRFPAHKYNLISGSSDEIEKDVLNDICEIGFIIGSSREEGLVSQSVTKEEVVLISPANYNIPEKIYLGEILNYPLIILKGNCIIKRNLKLALNYLGYDFDDLKIVSRLESTEAIKILVRKGYGLAFAPYNAVKEEYLDGKIQISRIDDYNLDYEIFMINKDFDKLDYGIQRFIEEFKNLGSNFCC